MLILKNRIIPWSGPVVGLAGFVFTAIGVSICIASFTDIASVVIGLACSLIGLWFWFVGVRMGAVRRSWGVVVYGMRWKGFRLDEGWAVSVGHGDHDVLPLSMVFPVAVKGEERIDMTGFANYRIFDRKDRRANRIVDTLNNWIHQRNRN